MATVENNDKSLCGLVLKAENVPVTIPAKYSHYTNVFLSDSAAELLERTGINDHPISLVDDKQPPYDLSSHPPALRYGPSARRTVTFDYESIIKVLII